MRKRNDDDLMLTFWFIVIVFSLVFFLNYQKLMNACLKAKPEDECQMILR